MAKPNDQYEALAREAAARIDADRVLQRQLTLLPDEAAGKGDGDARRTRGAGRAMSQMRAWLADRGYRLPEDVLCEIAGLNRPGQDALATSMEDAERILTWAQAGAVGVKGAPAVQTMAARMSALMQVYTMRLRAAEALIPYGAPKATPDAAPVNVTQIVVAGAQAPQAAQIEGTAGPAPARNVTPGARRIGPPPMPHEIVQNQPVADGVSRGADDGGRTDGASD